MIEDFDIDALLKDNQKIAYLKQFRGHQHQPPEIRHKFIGLGAADIAFIKKLFSELQSYFSADFKTARHKDVLLIFYSLDAWNKQYNLALPSLPSARLLTNQGNPQVEFILEGGLSAGSIPALNLVRLFGSSVVSKLILLKIKPSLGSKDLRFDLGLKEKAYISYLLSANYFNLHFAQLGQSQTNNEKSAVSLGKSIFYDDLFLKSKANDQNINILNTWFAKFDSAKLLPQLDAMGKELKQGLLSLNLFKIDQYNEIEQIEYSNWKFWHLSAVKLSEAIALINLVVSLLNQDKFKQVIEKFNLEQVERLSPTEIKHLTQQMMRNLSSEGKAYDCLVPTDDLDAPRLADLARFKFELHLKYYVRPNRTGDAKRINDNYLELAQASIFQTIYNILFFSLENREQYDAKIRSHLHLLSSYWYRLLAYKSTAEYLVAKLKSSGAESGLGIVDAAFSSFVGHAYLVDFSNKYRNNEKLDRFENQNITTKLQKTLIQKAKLDHKMAASAVFFEAYLALNKNLQLMLSRVLNQPSILKAQIFDFVNNQTPAPHSEHGIKQKGLALARQIADNEK